MSRKLDHKEFEYLAGTDVMIQMLRNKLVFAPTDLGLTIKQINGLLEAVDDYMTINAQGLYYVRRVEQAVRTINPAQIVIYTEHMIDRDSLRELIDVTLASYMLSA